MSLTTCSQQIVDQFMTSDTMKTFFHGHSFTANAIGCAVSCASLDLFEKSETWEGIKNINTCHNEFARYLKKLEGVENIRVTGTILAFELKTGEGTSYFNARRDEIYKYFISKNILLRPLGNVIYILPPYCIKKEELGEIYEAIKSFLSEL